MKLLRRGRDTAALPGVVGRARLDRRTSALLRRLEPGEIAVIDQVDLDRATAEALVDRQVAAVVNAAASTSGRYPTLGPGVLLSAGIPLLDRVGESVFTAVRDGELVRLDADLLHAGDRVVAHGLAQDQHSVRAAAEQARAGLVTQLEAFAAATGDFLLLEHERLLDGTGLPELRTSFADRHAVVVAPSAGVQDQLRALRPYLREHRPVLVGVDGGAEALRSAGLAPAVVVGDPDQLTDDVLRSGAEVVVHAPGGHAPGLQRVQDLGVPTAVVSFAGTGVDTALLLADAAGARVIVTVGAPATLAEFVDSGRQGMASPFLTRLRLGGKLVDASAVSDLHRPGISAWALLLLVLAAVLTMAVAVSATALGDAYGDLITDGWPGLRDRIADLR